jgi:hypothetical protein
MCNRGSGDISCQKNIAEHLMVIVWHSIAGQRAGKNTLPLHCHNPMDALIMLIRPYQTLSDFMRLPV